MARKIFFVFWLIVHFFQSVEGQPTAFPPSDQPQPGRLRTVIITEAAIGVLATAGLNYLWYRKFERSHFHFFNDNAEWLQMDKVGHATTAYNLSVMQHDLMRWCGVGRSQSILIGSLTALTYMSLIEVLDGFSAHWGFSKGDMMANLSGIALFSLQQGIWQDQRASLKFSFHYSPFAKYNPKELGNDWRSRIIKDYNGQTYWLSFRVRSFLSGNARFPDWLNLAAGYGVEGLTGGTANPQIVDGKTVPSFKRVRQFYISPDIDWTHIKSTPFINTAVFASRFLKAPAPALEWTVNQRLRLFAVYY